MSSFPLLLNGSMGLEHLVVERRGKRDAPFSSHHDSSLLKLARTRFPAGTPGNEIDRGVGQGPARPSNQEQHHGDKIGDAKPLWWAINKLFPTPCKQRAPELLLGAGLVLSDHGLSTQQPPAPRRPHSNLHDPIGLSPTTALDNGPLPASNQSNQVHTQTPRQPVPEALRPLFEAASLVQLHRPVSVLIFSFLPIPISTLQSQTTTTPSPASKNSIEIRVTEDGSFFDRLLTSFLSTSF